MAHSLRDATYLYTAVSRSSCTALDIHFLCPLSTHTHHFFLVNIFYLFIILHAIIIINVNVAATAAAAGRFSALAPRARPQSLDWIAMCNGSTTVQVVILIQMTAVLQAMKLLSSKVTTMTTMMMIYTS